MIKDIKKPIVILDVDQGHFVDCNEQALDFFHFTKEEILRKNPFDLSPPNVYGHEAEAYVRQVIQEALAGANPVFDWIHVDKEGNEIPCEVRLIRFPPFDRQLVRGTIIDKGSNINNIRESEERLRLSLEATDLGTFDWYPKEDKVFWDARLFKIFELESTDKIDLNAHFFSLLHPEDQERVGKEFEKSLKQNGPESHQTEYRVVIDGRVKHLLAYSRMIRDDEGEVIRMLGTTQDITKLRESEEKLRKNEELLDSIIQDQKEMIVRWKPGGFRTFVNKAYCLTFELDAKEAIGESFFSFLELSFKESFIKEVESLTPKNPVRTYTVHNPLPNGKKAWQEWSDRAYFDREGKAVEYQSVGRDITTQKQLEIQRQLVSERLKAISDNVPGIVFRYKVNPDFSDELVFVSDGVQNILGISPEDALSDINIVWSRFHPDDIEHVRQTIKESYENMTRWYAEWRTYLPDGSIGWLQGTGQPIKQEDCVIWDSIILDITSQKNLKQELEESEERYRNVFNQQFQFTAILDLDGKVIHVNDPPLKIHGREKADYIGKYFWESPALGRNKEWENKIKTQVLFVKKTKEALTVEDPFYGQNNEPRFATTSYSVIKNNNGDVVNIHVQAIDITKEKLASKEIEERERKLSMIYGNTNDFILLIRCDKNGYFLEEINDACLKLLDFFSVEIPKEKLIGISMREVYENLVKYPKEKVDERIKAFDYIVDKRKPVSFQQEMKTSQGLLVTTVDVVPVIQEEKVTHLLMVAKDITENHLGQKKLEEAYQQVSQLKSQLEQENIYLREEIKQANDYENMVFKSTEFRGVLKQVEQVAKTVATVLITGETGTGKELIARAIHNVSKRSEKPMIKVNTAAIPKDLIESELFGHEKGAFTGAVGEKPGKFELADGGTIFLDEIGDMPMELQVKILRVLQEGEVERLGSTKTKKIDVRIISATNKNLEEAVKDGRFREDLYFRLKVFPIEIPPLRSRPDDVPILVEHFAAKYGVKYSKPIKIIPKAVMDYLRNYSWPGNVRELENTIERAVILSTNEKLELPEVVDSTTTQEHWEHDNSLDVIMENHILKVLKECDWKIEGEDGAAAQLKIKPSTLRDRMRKFSIKRPR